MYEIRRILHGSFVGFLAPRGFVRHTPDVHDARMSAFKRRKWYFMVFDSNEFKELLEKVLFGHFVRDQDACNAVPMIQPFFSTANRISAQISNLSSYTPPTYSPGNLTPATS